jgi:hypothetical protein
MPITRPLALALVLLSPAAFAGASAWSPRYYAGWSQPPADLIVRPDLLTVGFSLRRVGTDPTKTVAELGQLVEALAKRLPPSSIRMRSIAIDASTERQASPDAKAVTVEGFVEIPLVAEADFWARARLEAQALAAFKPLTDDKKTLTTRVDRPQTSLRDPEPHRAELVRRWVERERGFATAAQGAIAPLVPLGCQPPGHITQIPLGLDEVGLALQLTCRLDTPAK